MAEQVVIPFGADTGPIDNAIKSIGTLNEGFQNLNETITEGAGNAVVKDLNNQLGQTADKMDTVRTKTQALSLQKRQLEEELARVSAEFGEESSQAKKLESAILGVSTKMRQHSLEMRELTKAGSDTGRMMGFLTHSTMGAMQAFGALNMAMAGGKEGGAAAEKAMMKSMEIMQLMQAATEIFNAKREIAGAKALIMTKLNTAAESENIIVKYAAIAAQTTLNAVIAMNPFGILITAVALIGAGFLAWNNQTKSVVAELEDLIKENDKLSESLKFDREETDKLFEAEKKLAKARGVNNDALHKMTQDHIKEENLNLNMEISIARNSLNAQAAINKEKVINHVSFWGTVGTVLTSGYGLWANMDDKQKEKIESNNGELDKAYQERVKNLNDLLAKQKSLTAEFLDDKKDAIEERKKDDEDRKRKSDENKKKLEALKKQKQDEFDASVEADKAAEQWDNQNELDIAADKKKMQDKDLDDLKKANETKLLLMKDSGASQEDILMANELEELRLSDGTELAKLKIMQKYDDLRVKQEQETQAKLKAAKDQADQQEKQAMDKKFNEARQIETQAFNFLSSMDKAAADKKMGEYTNELNHIEDLHDRKVLTDKDYAAQKKKIDDKMKAERQKTAEEEKRIKIAQATANLALSITKILAEGFKGDFGISDGILIALDTAIGVANIAQIANTPAYAKGTKKAAKGWKLVGEEGPELINDGGGYPVITHKDTMQILKKYDIPALNHGIFSNMESFQLNSGAIDEAIAGIMARGNGVSLDYDRLADKIGERVGQNVRIPETKTIFDENGFTEYVKTRDTERTYKSGRYRK
jgi:hypothetical protein